MTPVLIDRYFVEPVGPPGRTGYFLRDRIGIELHTTSFIRIGNGWSTDDKTEADKLCKHYNERWLASQSEFLGKFAEWSALSTINLTETCKKETNHG